MTEYTINNGTISITVKDKGAELSSLKKTDKSGEKEYMWCADPEFWGKSSPVLFPFVGRVCNNRYMHEGKVYDMPTQHGFARDNTFIMINKTDKDIWFSFSSNEETKKLYPFDFELQIGYELMEDGVKVLWKVKNTGSGKMQFSIGGHPAFVCPDTLVDREQCMVDFHTDKASLISSIVDTKTGLCKHEEREIVLQDGKVPATKELFEKDALIIENNQTQAVSLVNPKGERFLTVSFDAPLFGVWTPPDKKAPFICIEPWYGRCDYDDYKGELCERPWNNTLEASNEAVMSYTVTVQ